MQDLNKKMARGAAWMGLLRICVRGIGFVSTIILARLLLPEDFGIIAMAMSLIAFLELATAFSFEVPLIQKQDAGRAHFDSAWTMNVLFYSGLTVLLLLLAEPAAAFYNEPRLTTVIYVMAAGFLLRGFNNIGVVYFQKELDFRKDFILMLSRKVVGFLVTIPLAFMLQSYWAMIAGMVVGNAFGVLLSYAMHPYRPRFSLKASGELFNFSKWLLLNNFVNFMRNRSPDFIVGRIAGTSALGYYTVSYEIGTLPTTELVAPINRVVFPGYSKLAGDLAALRQSYLDVLRAVAVFALPAAFGLSAVAEPLIAVALGSKWLEAGPIVAVFALYGGINAIQTNTGSVFNARAKPYMITYIGTLNIAILVALSISLVLEYGVIGIAYAFLATSVLTAPVTYYYVCREVQLPLTKLIGTLFAPMMCSALMYLATKALIVQLAPGMHPAGLLAVLIPAGAALYGVMMVGIWYLGGRPHNVEYRVLLLLYRKLWRSTDRGETKLG